MTVTLNLNPDVQTEIEDRAKKMGMSVDALLASMIESQLPKREYDLDGLLKLPRNEQERAMEVAAARATADYNQDLLLPISERELTSMTVLDGERFEDDAD